MKQSTMSNDTICAVSTPVGVGGIAIIRVSGPLALEISSRVWKGKNLESMTPRSLHLGPIVNRDGELLDNALISVFKAPASFTGEDVVEFSVHGSAWIQQELINTLIAQGCRLARPGEFSRRAFASGRIDLAEAEGIADMISSTSKAAHRIAMSQMKGDLSRRLESLRRDLVDIASLLELELDFSEEDVEFASRQNLLDKSQALLSEVESLKNTFAAGNAIKNGVPVALVGSTNVGKSTLLNLLLGEEKAIVSDVHGTTRDIIEDTVDIEGVLFRFIDTAGIRQTSDKIEAMGIERSFHAIEKARIVICVVDGPDISLPRIVADQKLIVALNKADLLSQTRIEEYVQRLKETASDLTHTVVSISAKNNQGIEELVKAILKTSDIASLDKEAVVITNTRHFEALTNAVNALNRVLNGLNIGISGDFIAQDLREVTYHLGTITGAITTDDLLSSIFSRFCIGK